MVKPTPPTDDKPAQREDLVDGRPSEAAKTQPDEGQRTRTGETTADAAQHQLPQLQHERDQSAGSQELQRPDQREKMERARRDLEEGQQDTDRGEVMDKLYRGPVSSPRR